MFEKITNKESLFIKIVLLATLGLTLANYLAGSSNFSKFGNLLKAAVTEADTKADTCATVNSSVPYINSIHPSSVPVGYPEPLTITIRGGNFLQIPPVGLWQSDSTIIFDGITHMNPSATWISSNELQLTIPASTFASEREIPLVVKNEIMGLLGGFASDIYHSNIVRFYVVTSPHITSVQPSTAAVGDEDFSLTVYGTGFNATSQIYQGTTALDTTYVSDTELITVNPVSVPSAAQVYSIQVGNTKPDRGMIYSNAKDLTFMTGSSGGDF